MEFGSYIALGLLGLQLTLVYIFVKGKILKPAFWPSSAVIVFLIALFYLGAQITEVTIPYVGTIKAAANLASQYVTDITNIKTEVEGQKKVVDAVASSAKSTALLTQELEDKNAKATDQLKVLTGQIERAKQIIDQIYTRQEYLNESKLNFLGLTGAFGSDFEEHSALNNLISNFIHPGPQLKVDCTSDAVKAYTSAIQLDAKFPFSYYYRGFCSRQNSSGDWRPDFETARKIALVTTQIAGHHQSQDNLLSVVTKELGAN